MFPDWERRILSKPIPVHWAGFESNTLKLQNAGWEFSAEQSMENLQSRILIRHQAYQMHGCSAFVATNFFGLQRGDEWDGIRFPIQWMTSGGVQVHRIQDNLSAFAAVDMQPQLQCQHEIKNIEDMALFAGVSLARTKEVIVDPATVPDLMAQILEMQTPARKEYYDEKVRLARQVGRRIDEVNPRQKFHAQILSLAV